MVKTGQVVKVRVLEVDLARKRISLTMKLDAEAPRGAATAGGAGGTAGDNRHRPAERGQRAGTGAGAHSPGQGQGAMAAAFAKLRGPR